MAATGAAVTTAAAMGAGETTAGAMTSHGPRGGMAAAAGTLAAAGMPGAAPTPGAAADPGDLGRAPGTSGRVANAHREDLRATGALARLADGRIAPGRGLNAHPVIDRDPTSARGRIGRPPAAGLIAMHPPEDGHDPPGRPVVVSETSGPAGGTMRLAVRGRRPTVRPGAMRGEAVSIGHRAMTGHGGTTERSPASGRRAATGRQGRGAATVRQHATVRPAPGARTAHRAAPVRRGVTSRRGPGCPMRHETTASRRRAPPASTDRWS
jgi:hypothetical protein